MDLTTVGLSEAGDEKLDELKELGIFAEKMDGYRFAVALRSVSTKLRHRVLEFKL